MQLLRPAVCEKGSGWRQRGECWPCPRGWFNTGDNIDPSTGAERTDWSCRKCPDMTFNYAGQDPFTSGSTTLDISSETDSDCVPVYTQLVGG